MLWYHDHAWGITRFNPFLGQAAAYIVRDAGENALITGGQIPNGAYEVPIVLQDRLLDLATGAMIYPQTPTPGTHPQWIPEYFGDTPIVNGRAYPFLNVEPRRYRFRFLNGAQARFFSIWFNGAAGPIPMWVIGSEQGFLPAPVPVTRLVIAPGERFDTIFDFTGMPNGTILTLKTMQKALSRRRRGEFHR
jgi:spore coat protein A